MLWSGLFFSTAGQQMQTVIVAWQLYNLTNSALEVGLLGLFRLVPFVVASLAGGAIADLLDRRRIMLGAQLSLVLLTALLAVTTFNGTIVPWLIYGVTFLSGAATAFDNPARQALIPNLVPRDELGHALTLIALVRKTAMIVGPGVAGVLIGQAGIDVAYSANSALFLATALAVLMIQTQARGGLGAARGWQTVLGGLSYARREPLVWSAMLFDFVTGILLNIRTLLPMYARDILVVGPEGLGMLHMASSIGAVAGATVLAALSGGWRPLLLMMLAAAGEALCVIGFGLSHVFGLSLVFMFGGGLANVVGEVPRTTLIQVKTPDELRGRVMAISMVGSQGGPNLGQLESGALAALFGPAAAAIIGGSGVLLAIAGFLQFPVIRRGLAERQGR